MIVAGGERHGVARNPRSALIGNQAAERRPICYFGCGLGRAVCICVEQRSWSPRIFWVERFAFLFCEDFCAEQFTVEEGDVIN